MAHFDWYQGSVMDGPHTPETILGDLSGMFPLADVQPETPRNGYLRGAKVAHGSDTLCSLWWGGNPGVHLKATGKRARLLAPYLQQIGVIPSRVDAAEDFAEPGLADRLFKSSVAWAIDRKIRLHYEGDWARSKGRTLYLGARSSTAQLVIYEKGHQVGGNPDWVRLEVRLYPKRNRDQVAVMTPGQIMGASPWIARMFSECFGWDHFQPITIGTVRELTTEEKARKALIQQYSKIISRWADEVSWEHLGEVLGNAIEEAAREARNAQERARSAALL